MGKNTGRPNQSPRISTWRDNVALVIAVLSFIIASASAGVSYWSVWYTNRPAEPHAAFESIVVPGSPAFANSYIVPVTFLNSGARTVVIQDVALRVTDCKVAPITLQPVAVLKPGELSRLGNPNFDYLSDNGFTAFALAGGSSDERNIVFQTLDQKPLPMPWPKQEVDMKLTVSTSVGVLFFYAQALFARHVPPHSAVFVQTKNRLMFNIAVQSDILGKGYPITMATPQCNV